MMTLFDEISFAVPVRAVGGKMCRMGKKFFTRSGDANNLSQLSGKGKDRG